MSYGSATDNPLTQSSNQRYPVLDGVLHTQDGFKRFVTGGRSIDTVFWWVIIALAVAAVANGLATAGTMQSMHVPASAFFRLLFDTTRDGSGSGMHALDLVLVGCFVVALALAVILEIVRKVMYGSTIQRMFDSFMRGGFVFEYVPTGWSWYLPGFRGGINSAYVQLFAHPSVPRANVEAFIQNMAAMQQQATPEAAAYMSAIQKLSKKAGSDHGIQLRRVDASVSPGIYITWSMFPSPTGPSVAVPDGDDPAKMIVCDVRKQAPRN